MRFGLIGHPIAHSLSPALFKAGYDGRYPYELIENADFEEAYKTFLNEYDGINVTAPFKEMAFAKADVVSEECQVIGATNLLVKTPEGVKAYNSDFLGVRLVLRESCLPCQKMDAPYTTLVVGIGGAGKAAAVAAASLGSRCILMNRSIEKAEAMAGSLSEAGYIAEARPMSDFRECFREADIIIYNIPTAVPQMEELNDEDFTPGRSKHILEANYKNPSFDNGFIARMKEANPAAEYISGKRWLLYQAVTGYEIFTGEKPDLARMADVL